MDARMRALAQTCLEGAEADTMTFPQIVGALIDGGFESYEVDFRRSAATYFAADGEALNLKTHEVEGPIAARLDIGALGAAIREAQNLVPGYSYRGFCAKAKAAGCAGYMVSFPGRRAVYFGRDGTVHTEHFPD